MTSGSAAASSTRKPGATRKVASSSRGDFGGIAGAGGGSALGASAHGARSRARRDSRRGKGRGGMTAPGRRGEGRTRAFYRRTPFRDASQKRRAADLLAA